jgi:2-phospho-L-lactate guanylyltransferase
MRAIIPFKKENPKSRLSPLLVKNERERLAELMLQDVLEAVRGAGIPAKVLTSNSLNESINREISAGTPLLIVMSDLPLISSNLIRDIVSSEGEVVISPGRRGGTNILFLRRDFQVDYYELSFIKHVKKAEKENLSVRVYDSFYASCDIDEPQDLLELLVHGKGKSASYLRKILKIEIESGLPTIRRAKNP